MIGSLERRFERIFTTSGGMLMLLLQSLGQIHFGRRDRRRIIKQLFIIGYQTAALAILIGLFTGMTVALNTGLVLEDYGQQILIAQVVALALMREMGPVITAVIITGRVGSAMTAELGTMSVNEEIDVLRVLGIRVERYLVAPRLLASIIMAPLLTVYGVIVGIAGGAIIARSYFGVSFETYQNKTWDSLEFEDIWKGLFKSLVFGVIYAMICCYMGLTTRGGAEGVGRHTTKAVVFSLSAILIANYLLTRFLFG